MAGRSSCRVATCRTRGSQPITSTQLFRSVNPFRSNSGSNSFSATGSVDKTARLWDLGAKDPAASPVVLRGHDGSVSEVAISPDNRWIVTGGDDSAARLWLLQLNDLINLAHTTVGRNFSADEWKLYFPGEKYRRTFDELPALQS